MNKFILLSLFVCFGIFGQTVIEDADYPTGRQREVRPFAGKIKDIISILKAYNFKTEKLNYFQRKDDLILSFTIKNAHNVDFFHALTFLESISEIDKFEVEEDKSAFSLDLKIKSGDPELPQNLSLILEEFLNTTKEEDNKLSKIKLTYQDNELLLLGESNIPPSTLKEIYSEKISLFGFQLEDFRRVSTKSSSSSYQLKCRRFFDPFTKKGIAPKTQYSAPSYSLEKKEYIFLSPEVWDQFGAEIFVKDIQLGPKVNEDKIIGFEFFTLGKEHLFSQIGLQKGDAIVQMNGEKLSDMEKIINALSWMKDAAYLEIDILRNEKYYRFILFRP